VRVELEMLEHHADARSQCGQVGRARANLDAFDPDASRLIGSRPLMHLISVLLPEPDGPHITTTSPRLIDIVQSRSTTVGPYGFDTLSRTIIGSSVMQGREAP